MKKKKSQNTSFILFLKKHSGLLTFALFLAVVIASFIFADRGTFNFYKAHSEKEALEEEIKKLEAKRDSLLIEQERLTNDPTYIEKVAREKYNMKKKDETVYKIEVEKDN